MGEVCLFSAWMHTVASVNKMASNEAKTGSREPEMEEEERDRGRAGWPEHRGTRIPHDWISVVQDVNASLLV